MRLISDPEFGIISIQTDFGYGVICMALIRSFSADALRVYVYDSRSAMGQAAADAAANHLRALLAEKDRVNMIFAAAPSQNEMLDALCAAPGIDWTRVRAFHMDEYIGLPQGAPQAFSAFLHAHIFDRLPFGEVHCLNPQAEDAKAECRRYSELWSRYPVDIVCLGIGENGHIAFNDPWVADFDDPDPVKIVPLDPVCRQQQVNDGCFQRLSDVPERAITLTIPALARAAHLVCTVPAASKADAVAWTVQGEISAKVPATVMRRHPSAGLYLDPDSAAKLAEAMP